MTDKAENGVKVPNEKADEFDEFAKIHPERCVELTQQWKDQLLRNLEKYFSKYRSES